jgi:predicted ATPase with chaperone activity
VSHQVHAAKFPVHSDLAGLDFAVVKGDSKLVHTLVETGFIEVPHSLVLVDGPGTGKTAVAQDVALQDPFCGQVFSSEPS